MNNWNPTDLSEQEQNAIMNTRVDNGTTASLERRLDCSHDTIHVAQWGKRCLVCGAILEVNKIASLND